MSAKKNYMKKIFSKINFLYVGISILLLASSMLLFNFSGDKVVNKITLKSVASPNLQDSSISLFFVGDMMGHQSMIDAAQVKGENKYDYMDWFQFLSPYLENKDYAVANLEVTLGGSPYSGYPQFCSPDSYAEAIQKAGFDFIITANNHSQDKGKKGLERTIDVLNQLNFHS